jgi:hypothetical protein
MILLNRIVYFGVKIGNIGLIYMAKTAEQISAVGAKRSGSLERQAPGEPLTKTLCLRLVMTALLSRESFLKGCYVHWQPLLVLSE